MWWYLAAALAGAAVAGKRKPTTPCSKREAIGPRTGAHYRVDDFASAGFLVVYAQDGTMVTMTRDSERGRLVYKDGKGVPATLKAIRLDFIGEEASA